MIDAVTPGEGVLPSRALTPSFKGRLALVFTVLVVAACIVAAALLFSRASQERQGIKDRALSTAIALSSGFDQEVAAVNYLLKGLSKSPALLSGDVEAFHRQLKETPVPEGSGLALFDLERQLANSLRPFGDSTLPKVTAIPNYQEQIDRIRERRWAVSGRLYSLVKHRVVVALSLRIDGPDGEMKNWITTTLSDERLDRILDDPNVPAGWSKALYDRKMQPIVTAKNGQSGLEIPAPVALRTSLDSAGPNNVIAGLVEGIDGNGMPVLIAYRRSGATNWTTAVAVPLAIVDAPIAGVLWQLAGPAAILLLVGGLAALLMARQFERPMLKLSHLVIEAKSEVTELSAQLLALQEEERQRIARELHDSTAQRLVAAGLGLGRLEAKLRQSPAGLKTCGEIGEQLDGALMELRIFTYLLHPPNLAQDGLRTTLMQFVDGFARRTGLSAFIRVSNRLDEASPEIQRSVLRVVQEALSNVHRHAGASTVHVGAKIVADRLVVRVRDNGRGMTMPGASMSGLRMGVGIPGMRARLQQFGGDLKIRTGASGTSLLAYVPLSERSGATALILPLRGTGAQHQHQHGGDPLRRSHEQAQPRNDGSADPLRNPQRTSG
jgi:signal transduction histidine kinase